MTLSDLEMREARAHFPMDLRTYTGSHRLTDSDQIRHVKSGVLPRGKPRPIP